MPIRFIKFISRDLVRSKPNAWFVFGDNLARVGMGGQAKEMRGEPNAIGVCTKRSPKMLPSSFFSDTDEDWWAIKDDLRRIKEKLEAGQVVYVPSAGLGVERAMLRERAPELYRRLYSFFNVASNGKCPWPSPSKPN